MLLRDLYTDNLVCTHPSCHWLVPGEVIGYSGVEARYENEDGKPACWSHRDPSLDGAEE